MKDWWWVRCADALAWVEPPLVTGDPEKVSGLIRAKRPQLVLLDLMLDAGMRSLRPGTLLA